LNHADEHQTHYNDEPEYKKVKAGHLPKDWNTSFYRKYNPGERHPVVNVDWYDAYAYCVSRGKRLPTEPEWEKAAGWWAEKDQARKFNYPWGDQFDSDRANTSEAWQQRWDDRRTTEVGNYESGKSFYGIYDMAGNAFEWTDTWYNP